MPFVAISYREEGTAKGKAPFFNHFRVQKMTGWQTKIALCWPIQGTDTKRILLDIYNDYQALNLRKNSEHK